MENTGEIQQTNRRNCSIQVIRGICILAVVAIHCPSGLNLDHNSPLFWGYFILRQALCFPVAIFLFLSGYLINQEKWEVDSCKAIIGRFKRLALPYLFWTIIYVCAKCVFKGSIDTDLGNCLLIVFAGRAGSPFYYIVVLLQLTLLTPLLLKRNPPKHIILWLITPVAMVLLYVFSINSGSIPWYCNTLFPVWLLFFFLGIQVRARNSIVLDIVKKSGKVLLVLVSLLFCIAEGFLIIFKNQRMAVSQNRASAYLYAFILIAVSFRYIQMNHDIGSNVIERSIKKIGDISFGIFWIHSLVIEIVKTILGKTPLLQNWLMFFLVSYIATVCISVVCIFALQSIFRYFKKESWLQYIGL